MELGKPTFVPVQDLEMGFEKIVNIAHSRGGKSLLFEVHLNGFLQVIALNKHANCSMQTKGCNSKIENWGQLNRTILLILFCTQN